MLKKENNKKHQADFKKRKYKEGLCQLTLWCRIEDRDYLRDMTEVLKEERDRQRLCIPA